MHILKGKSACGGIASGRIAYLKKEPVNISKRQISDIKAETDRFEKAKTQAIGELKVQIARASSELGQKNAEILEAHLLMLTDEDFCDAIRDGIRKGINAEAAISDAAHSFSNMLLSMDGEYMQARASDVFDIAHRLTSILSNRSRTETVPKEQVIIAASDLAPSETICLDKKSVLAIITSEGSENSHTAILARAMGIPAIIRLGRSLEDCDGKYAIVDGSAGEIFIDPDEKTKNVFAEAERQKAIETEELIRLKNAESVTADGRKIKIFANIAGMEDLIAAEKNGAEGIGLFRSEFLYLENRSLPSEEEQFNIYRHAAEQVNGKKVIIRTLDIGADKQLEGFSPKNEVNPAMGMRGIRLCLSHPDVFKTQLRAIFRAAAYGNVALMFPMITSVSEIDAARKIADEAKKELSNEGVKFNPSCEIGIMIETPAAAEISDILAEKADFFSIGTNDLTQYLLAADRQNSLIADYYDAHHEAVLRLIRRVTKNAHQKGIWVGICGELGADEALTEMFIDIGIDELSVVPPSILSLRKKVRSIGISQA